MPLILLVHSFFCVFFFHGVNYMIQYDSTAYSRLHTSYFSSQSRAGVFVRVLNLCNISKASASVLPGFQFIEQYKN